MAEVLAGLANSGVERVGIYGAGQHTRELKDVLAASPVSVVAILDDDAALAGQSCAGLPIVPVAAATDQGIGAVVISSDRFEEQIWNRRAALTARGIPVHRLYGDGKPPTHYERGWDEYARHWQKGIERVTWSSVSKRHVPTDDQSTIERPGDEWGVAPVIFERLLEPAISRDSVVLEIGPGSGRISEQVYPHCRELHVVEISDEMIAALHDRLGQPPNVYVHKVHDVDLSMFADNTFDMAYSIGVFVHLQIEDIYRYLRDLRRVLKPGAFFILEGYADLEGEAKWHSFLEKVAAFDAGYRDNPRCFQFVSSEMLAKFYAALDWLPEPFEHGLRLRCGKS
ncbi:MAG: methyltransferase domain-containing protein [Phycisphaerae bacterium]|nr:methyltransferase domain-containing protein [Phycisphaerae bacterium]